MTTEAEVLGLLKSTGDPVSGEEIGSRLGLSRTAVWKAVERLRRSGYGIEASPSKGYSLKESPDSFLTPELDQRLTTRWLGHRIHALQEVDSTNRVAYDLALKGAAEGEVVIAEGQTHGRGRLGRSWFAPPGLNLYASIVLRPSIPPHAAPQISLAAGLAIARAVERLSGLRPSIKWPNDVLLKGRKLAGVLLEMHAENDVVRFVILGPGVNLNITAAEFPKEIASTATSIAIETGEPLSRIGFTAALFEELEQAIDRWRDEGFAAIRSGFESYADLRGRLMRVAGPTRTVSGNAEGLDDDGALLLRTDEGKLERVIAGDVTMLRGAGSARRGC